MLCDYKPKTVLFFSFIGVYNYFTSSFKIPWYTYATPTFIIKMLHLVTHVQLFEMTIYVKATVLPNVDNIVSMTIHCTNS